jgi:hypothetical protein
MSAKQFVGCVAIAVLPLLPARGGRPLTIDDAAPVASGQLQLEAGVGYVKNGGTDHLDFPLTLTYGLPWRLEVGVGFGSQIEERENLAGGTDTESGLGDLVTGFKWQLLDAARAWADQSLACAVKFPTADHDKGMGTGETDYDLTWIVSKPITDRWGVNLNVGYTWVGEDGDTLHYGVAGNVLLTKRIELVAEVFADTPLVSGAVTSVSLNGGVRWNLFNSLVLDAAVGAGLCGDAPNLTATTGFTWTFDFGKNRQTR